MPRAQGVIVSNVLDRGRDYGHSDELAGTNINLEFVSANPTGPIHIGGTRWAAVGDALGRLLSTQGADVIREYYFNDHGAQIDRFTDSLIAAANGEPTPEDGYAGDYINDIAAQVLAKEPDALTLPDGEKHETFRSIGVDLMFDPHQAVAARVRHRLRRLHPRRLDAHQSGARRRGHRASCARSAALYEKDGAIWLRTTDFGDDKDRVVIKSDGNPAYIAGDIAYFLDKRAARLRPVHLHARRRPPRLHRAGSRPPPPRSATTPTPSRC